MYAITEEMDPVEAVRQAVSGFWWARVQVVARAKGSVRFSGWTGSALRSALGLRLKAGLCAQALGTACGGCPQREGCPFPPLMAPEGVKGASRGVTPAVIVEPPAHPVHTLEDGHPLCFSVVIMGRPEGLPAVKAALACLETEGIGDGRGRLSLDRIEILQSSHEGFGPWLGEGPRPLPSAAEVTMMTPVDASLDHQPLRCFDVHALSRLVHRRVRLVLEAHGGGVALPSFDALPPLEGVVLKPGQLRRVQRYSRTQRQTMRFTGVTGSLKLTGALAAWGPLLALGEVIHLGRHTAFGMGRYSLKPTFTDAR